MAVAPHANPESPASVHNSHQNSNGVISNTSNGVISSTSSGVVEDQESSESEDDGDEVVVIDQQIAFACDDGCVRIYCLSESSELVYSKSLSRVSGEILTLII